MVILSTGCLYFFGLERAFKIAKLSQFEGIELMLRPPGTEGFWDTWDNDYLQYLQEKNDLKIVTLHNHFKFEEDPTGMTDVVNLAEKLRVNNIVMHIPRAGQEIYKRWFDDYFKNKVSGKIHCLIENMGGKALIKDPIIWNRFSDFCFDTTHSLRAGENPLELISQMSNIREIHISDFHDGKTHSNPLNNKLLFDKILSINKKFIKCLEVRPEVLGSPDDQETIINNLITLRKYLKKFD